MTAWKISAGPSSLTQASRLAIAVVLVTWKYACLGLGLPLTLLTKAELLEILLTTMLRKPHNAVQSAAR